MLLLLLLLQVDILRDTVMGALNAALPIGTKRTIYLCDDLPGEKRLQENCGCHTVGLHENA
jgi:hypothetical protein